MSVTPFTLELLTEAMKAVKSGPRIHPLILDGRSVYLMTVTPQMHVILVMHRAKDKWKRQHRAARIAAKKAAGFVYLDTSINYEDWS